MLKISKWAHSTRLQAWLFRLVVNHHRFDSLQNQWCSLFYYLWFRSIFLCFSSYLSLFVQFLVKPKPTTSTKEDKIMAMKSVRLTVKSTFVSVKFPVSDSSIDCGLPMKYPEKLHWQNTTIDLPHLSVTVNSLNMANPFVIRHEEWIRLRQNDLACLETGSEKEVLHRTICLVILS